MRTLFRRFIRWLTQADRFERLESQVLVLQSTMLTLGPVEEVFKADSYDYGEIGEMYRITANSELVSKRENL